MWPVQQDWANFDPYLGTLVVQQACLVLPKTQSNFQPTGYIPATRHVLLAGKAPQNTIVLWEEFLHQHSVDGESTVPIFPSPVVEGKEIA